MSRSRLTVNVLNVLGTLTHRLYWQKADNRNGSMTLDRFPPIGLCKILKRGIIMRYSKLLTTVEVAILLTVGSLVTVANANSDESVQTAGAVTYVSGGVGEGSLDRLRSLTGDFNLKLVFALKSGAYLSGVGVSIADAAGKTLLDTTSEGPWFLVSLPAGNYQIVATSGGHAVKRQIAVGAAKLRTVDFRWATE